MCAPFPSLRYPWECGTEGACVTQGVSQTACCFNCFAIGFAHGKLVKIYKLYLLLRSLDTITWRVSSLKNSSGCFWLSVTSDDRSAGLLSMACYHVHGE
jgi:hypothetical protein